DSRKTAPPARFANASAAAFGSRQAMSRSSTGLPRSSSRIAPPTTHASCPARTSRASSSIDDLALGPFGARLDPRGDLVVDRPDQIRVLLDQKPVADDCDRLADRELARE